VWFLQISYLQPSFGFLVGSNWSQMSISSNPESMHSINGTRGFSVETNRGRTFLLEVLCCNKWTSSNQQASLMNLLLLGTWSIFLAYFVTAIYMDWKYSFRIATEFLPVQVLVYSSSSCQHKILCSRNKERKRSAIKLYALSVSHQFKFMPCCALIVHIPSSPSPLELPKYLTYTCKSVNVCIMNYT
jgi:hypothetical protein